VLGKEDRVTPGERSGANGDLIFDRQRDFGKWPSAAQKQPLSGFDDDYVDILDYIVRSTHKIWEEHGIGLIYTHYKHNTPVHASSGLSYGRERVIANTIQSQAAMPDAITHADDVIWGGNERDGYTTSHRFRVVGRNTGYSVFGPPTNRKVETWGIANCVVRENRVVEEWLYNNEVSLIRQLGLPIRATVERIAPPMLDSLGVDTIGQIERTQGQGTPEPYPPRSGGFDIEDFVRRSVHEIWNWRLLNKINEYYVENYLYHGATDREAYGRGNYMAYVLSVLAMFPDAVMRIDDLYWNGNEQEGYRSATRWTLLGTHSGPGVYGEPTNQQVQMNGVTQHLVRNGRFVEEYTLFNELQILQQLWFGR
jgi:hypothetical protein